MAQNLTAEQQSTILSEITDPLKNVSPQSFWSALSLGISNLAPPNSGTAAAVGVEAGKPITTVHCDKNLRYDINCNCCKQGKLHHISSL